jgi:chromosome segregation ATPase
MNDQLKELMKALLQMDSAIINKQMQLEGHSTKLDELTKEIDDLTIQMKKNITDLQKQLTQ